MPGSYWDAIGSSFNRFRIGVLGPWLRDMGGVLVARNPADDADAPLRGSTLAASSGSVTIGNTTIADQASAEMTVRFPVAKATNGQVLAQKAGTAANVLEFELVSTDTGGGTLKADVTSLAFGSSATVPMFQKPANATIARIEFIVDASWDTAATISIGVTGNTAKYAAASRFNLQASASEAFFVHPNLPPEGAEDLIITYAAAGATAGAARVIVIYGNPT